VDIRYGTGPSSQAVSHVAARARTACRLVQSASRVIVGAGLFLPAVGGQVPAQVQLGPGVALALARVEGGRDRCANLGSGDVGDPGARAPCGG